jgi:hypothetical protein
MKRVSDRLLLLYVLAIPALTLLVNQVLARALNEPSDSKIIAMGCALILMLIHPFWQLAGRKFATNGPRSLENWLGYYGAFLAMLLLGRMPSDGATVGQAALDVLPIPLIIAAIGGFNIARHIKALRRHPRALRAVARQYVIVVGFSVVLFGLMAIGQGFTWAQWIWGSFVFTGVMFPAAGGSYFWNKTQMSVLRVVTLALANALSFNATMTIFIYVWRLGEISADESAPLWIGGIIGAFFPFLIMGLIRRRRVLRSLG